jgi:bacillopeptidase F
MLLSKRWTLAGLGLLAFLLAVPPRVQAGQIHQRFAEALARTAPQATISGLVMVSEQPDVAAMERQLTALGWSSRWRRHQFVVQSAQELAARTQADLLPVLEAWKAEGAVQSYESFWVTNMIAVEAQPLVFERLAARDDVGMIYENEEIHLRLGVPDPGNEPTGGPRTLPDALICVNVESAWTLGFKGQGRLVCDFDTGADGNHPALAGLWRGNQQGVDWSAAWHDPYTNTTFPYDSGSHGTHTLGIMVATKPDGTAIGVAPSAQWIAAGILISWNVQKIINAYQWATDPDGNPGTISDVPDVINNSWGTSGDCEQTFWNAIEVVEAAGIVNTIAVDNTGPGYASVNSPESRALTPTVNWGVGNVSPHQEGYPIANSSGRGPSPCDMTSIKPEVTAPGTQIYSTMPNNSYGNLSGCSMACPHTSGAVAILRQADPELTVDEVKSILMATALDRGTVGEDNDYGWGIIDVSAALDYVLASLPVYPPRNLVAEPVNQTVTLTWQSPEDINPGNPLLHYRVYRAPVEEPFPSEPIAEVGLLFSIPTFEDENVPPGTYHYVVTGLYTNGESGPSNEAVAVVDVPAAADGVPLAAVRMLTVAPNPCNPMAVVRYVPSGVEPMRLSVFNTGGERVKSLVMSAKPTAGPQSVLWDGTDEAGNAVASGNYFVRFEQGDRVATQRLTLLK